MAIRPNESSVGHGLAVVVVLQRFVNIRKIKVCIPLIMPTWYSMPTSVVSGAVADSMAIDSDLDELPDEDLLDFFHGDFLGTTQ